MAREDKESLGTKNLTAKRPPKVPFLKIKNAILGKRYFLSLVFTNNLLSKKLNRIYRNKDKPTNILSFPLTPVSGEVFLNLPLIHKESKRGDLSFTYHTLQLFIHGLFHLKGLRHGSKMERAELKFLKKFSSE